MGYPSMRVIVDPRECPCSACELTFLRSTPTPRDLLEQQASQSPHVVSLCGAINAFYAIITDGDQPTKDDEKVKEVKKVAKEVKDIQAMVRNFTFQAQELLPNSSEFHPIFVHLLA